MGGTTSFNTASGKYCCNAKGTPLQVCKFDKVSIPQAVSTVATRRCIKAARELLQSFNTASGKYCCNHSREADLKGVEMIVKFQYRKR